MRQATQIILDILGFIFMAFAPWLLLGMLLLIGLDSALANVGEFGGEYDGEFGMIGHAFISVVFVALILFLTWRSGKRDGRNSP